MSVFVEVERGQNKHWDYSLIFAGTPSGKDKTGIPISSNKISNLFILCCKHMNTLVTRCKYTNKTTSIYNYMKTACK